jgi:hypothetical protein
MGIVRLPSTELYWQVTNNVLPTHPPTKSMTSVRWHQIKRYIKVSSQQMESKSTVWFSKTEPIFSHLNSMFKKFWILGTESTFDEMMICGKPTIIIGNKYIMMMEKYTYNS